jgi:hypothetical protein
MQPSIAIATSRAKELAIVDFEYARDHDAAAQAIRQLNEALRAPFGIKLSGEATDLLARATADPPENLKTVIVTSGRPSEVEEQVRRLRERKITTLLEATRARRSDGRSRWVNREGARGGWQGWG